MNEKEKQALTESLNVLIFKVQCETGLPTTQVVDLIESQLRDKGWVN